jgi:hypothetical protein
MMSKKVFEEMVKEFEEAMKKKKKRIGDKPLEESDMFKLHSIIKVRKFGTNKVGGRYVMIL